MFGYLLPVTSRVRCGSVRATWTVSHGESNRGGEVCCPAHCFFQSAQGSRQLLHSCKFRLWSAECLTQATPGHRVCTFPQPLLAPCRSIQYTNIGTGIIIWIHRHLNQFTALTPAIFLERMQLLEYSQLNSVFAFFISFIQFNHQSNQKSEQCSYSKYLKNYRLLKRNNFFFSF